MSEWSRVAEPFVGAAREIELLEVELRRLETEYQMFFAGQLPRPPWETRGRVDALVKRIDRAPLSNYGARFRFTTLQARFMAFANLWDRRLRAREEGRAGPVAQVPSIVEQAPPPPIVEQAPPPPIVEQAPPPPIVEQAPPPPIVEQATLPPIVEQATPPPMVEQATPPPIVEQATPPQMVEQATLPPIVEQATPPPIVEQAPPPPIVEQATPPPIVEQAPPPPDVEQAPPRRDRKQAPPRRDRKQAPPRRDRKQAPPRRDRKQATPRQDRKQTTPPRDRKQTTPRQDRKQTTPPRDRELAVANVSDRTRDQNKVQDLFEKFAAARREAGQKAVPYEKFAELVETQLGAFRRKGSREVAFRVSVKGGKASFSGRAKRGTGESEG